MRAVSLLTGVGAAALLSTGLLFGLTQCSSIESVQRPEPRENKYGAYLAGRFATGERDASAAASYYDRALRFDPDNPELLERALISEVTEGDIDGAARHSEQLTAKSPTARMPYLVIGAKALRDGGYAAADAAFSKISGNAAAEIAAKLGRAYALLGEGKPDEAIEQARSLTGYQGVTAFAKYHLAVIADLAGRKDVAAAEFASSYRASEGQSLRIVHAYAVFLLRNGKTAEGRTVYRNFNNFAPNHPVILSAMADAEAGRIPNRTIGDAKQGMAEVLYGIASSLSDEQTFEIPVFYLQLALALDPRHELAVSLLADRYETAKQWDQAIAVCRRIPSSSPLYVNSQLQIAQDFSQQERYDDAMAVLKAAATGGPYDFEVYAAIGDNYRNQEKYAEAVDAYTKAISLIDAPKERHWAIYYTRGVAYERTKRWAEAEKDLKFSLSLKPDQALVMNYLAYSWVEQGVHVDEAMEMLKKAVALRPEDGFVIDSLGWAYYKRGDYASAAKYLEQAILLEPGEAAINDHLGDTYWRLGRKVEAKYQWQHALQLKPEKEDEAAIRRKVEVGLEGPAPGAPTAAQAQGVK